MHLGSAGLLRCLAVGLLALASGASHADSDDVAPPLRVRSLAVVSQFDGYLLDSDIDSARGLFCDEPKIGYIGAHLAVSDVQKGLLPIEELFKPQIRETVLEYKFTKRYLMRSDPASHLVSVSRDSEPQEDDNGEERTLFQSFKIRTSESRACLHEIHMLERDF